MKSILLFFVLILFIQSANAVDGNWSEWSDWTKAPVSCGSDTFLKTRTRTCDSPPPDDTGLVCEGSATETEEELLMPCEAFETAAVWSQWGKWVTDCSGNLKVIKRTRQCVNPTTQEVTTGCDGISAETQAATDCPINGGWTPWTPWSALSVTCGTTSATQTRTRTCTNPVPSNGGTACVGSNSESQTIPVPSCTAIINGVWGTWGPWTAITITCSDSTVSQSRTRQCNNPAPANGGAACIGSNTETQQTALPSCAINGGWSQFGNWSAPSVTCGTTSATSTRSRECNNPSPANGGLACVGQAKETKTVDVGSCGVNGNWGPWSEWSKRSATCNQGPLYISRTRQCNNPAPSGNGLDCSGVDAEIQQVPMPPCEVITVAPTTTTLKPTTTDPAKIPGTCYCSGDPHCSTFDNAKIDYQGTCRFIFAKSKFTVSSTSTFTPFVVYVKNYNLFNTTKVAYVQYVEISYGGKLIHMERRKPIASSPIDVYVDSDKVGLPYISMEFQIIALANEVKFVNLANIEIKYSAAFRVSITVPGTYRNKVDGFCGNFDGLPATDFVTASGTAAIVPGPNAGKEIGDSFVTDSDTVIANSKCKVPIAPPNTECTLDVSRCKAINDPAGAFKSCISVMDPKTLTTAKDNCLFDAAEICLEKVICDALADFAKICYSYGVAVDWRKTYGCPCECSEKNEECVAVASGCQPTCVNLQPFLCDEKDLLDSCVCVEGYVKFAGNCIPVENCGCTEMNGVDRNLNENWLNKGCTKQMSCQKNGYIDVSNYACPAGTGCVDNVCVVKEKGWRPWGNWTLPTPSCGNNFALVTRTRICASEEATRAQDCIGSDTDVRLVVVKDCSQANLAANKPSYITDPAYNGPAKYAVDENPNPTPDDNSCAFTKSSDVKNWFVVDLLQQYSIQLVEVVIPFGAERVLGMKSFLVGVSATFSVATGVNRGTYPLCAQYPGLPTEGSTASVMCDVKTPPGRYVFVQQAFNAVGPLTICEIEVNGQPALPNLAFKKPAFESSNKPDSPVTRAVDGNTSPIVTDNSCSSTADDSSGPANWYAVDLRDYYYVKLVIISSQSNCCADKLASATIGVDSIFDSTKGPTRGGYALCGTMPATLVNGEQVMITCDRTLSAGRYVFVQASATAPNGPMAICEIEVYGHPALINLAWKRPVYQSGLINPEPWKAVDGDTKLTCTTIVDEPARGNWIVIDLQYEYSIKSVFITPTQDNPSSLTNVIVLLVNGYSFDVGIMRGEYAVCGIYKGTPAASKKFEVRCSTRAVPVRYVIVQQPLSGPGNMSLCEIEVFGQALPNLALLRPAYQSTTAPDADASKAVDGNPDPVLASKSCSMTTDDAGGPNWFVVDLQQQFYIFSVAIYNRQDCCTNNLNNVIIGVTNTFEPGSNVVRGSYEICGVYDGDSTGKVRIFVACDQQLLPQRFVIVQQPATGFGKLTLCEVEVFGKSTALNLALGRPAYLSSTLQDGEAPHAVDGIMAPNYGSLSCVSTNDGSGGPNWFVVDLEATYQIEAVVLTNRKDCCSNSLTNVIIGVIEKFELGNNIERGSYPVCGSFNGDSSAKNFIEVQCDVETPSGRYILVQQPVDGQGYLNFCELEVYGEMILPMCANRPCKNRASCTDVPALGYACTCEGKHTGKDCDTDQTNLALLKPAYLSSANNQRTAGRAVDGNRNPVGSGLSCASTNDNAGMANWLVVDLQQLYMIKTVIVTNREDLYSTSTKDLIIGILSDFSVSKGVKRGTYPICGKYPGKAKPGARMVIDCDRKTASGRYVVAQQPVNGEGMLNICELEAYGYRPIIGTTSTCVCQGDPHCQTFDEAKIDYHGTCKYLFSRTLASAQGVQPYAIYVKNQNLFNVLKVAYVQYVEISFAKSIIKMERKSPLSGPVYATVDGIKVNIPFSRSAFEIVYFGDELHFKTESGLIVQYKPFRVSVTLPSIYKGKVAGFCGNYDTDPKNDFYDFNGNLIPNTGVNAGNPIGDSYIVESPDEVERKKKKVPTATLR